MRAAHQLERSIGIAHYASKSDGIGGYLRQSPSDFSVRELERFPVRPLDSEPGEYPHIVLRVKLTAWDTNDFARRLSNELGMSRERISWAGTKDKHANTTQLFTVANVDDVSIPAIDGATISVIGRAGRPILFGDLAGNAFEIRIADVERPKLAEMITQELADFGGFDRSEPGPGRTADSEWIGVPNFFGHQRFGSHRPITNAVGRHIVAGDFEAAVMAYLAETYPTEPEETRQAREFVAETRDWREALDRFPHHLRYERSMLHVLSENDQDGCPFTAALEELPTNLQQLFVHAVQSELFNRILSERLERGIPFHRPVTGDVVCFIDTDSPDGTRLPDTDRLQQVTASRRRSIEKHCSRHRAFITAPLIGTKTSLSGGEPGDIEQKVLDDMGLEPEDFDLPEPYRSAGTVRSILIVTSFSFDRESSTATFSLPKGSYATTVLREYLKSHPERLT